MARIPTPLAALLIAVTSSSLAHLPAQGDRLPPPRDLTDQFHVPDGLQVTLWAESPQVFNPTAMDVDSRGRIWVTEAVNYRKWNGRNPGRDHAEGDRVVILEDKDGDGMCDTSTVFVQSQDLVAPLGIAVFGNQVLVSCSPRAILYTDENGDDVPDRTEVFLEGFGGFDHDHGLHSFVAGPDGSWTFNAGNAGPHVVTDRSGWTLRSGSLYRDGGAKAADNRPGLVSDDGRIWTGGITLRIDPDGRRLLPLAHNFRNAYEVAVDSFGDLWQSDNDDDGNKSCRTTWVLPGGNYGYFSDDGSRTWQADRRPGQATAIAHWHQDDPGVCPSGTINGAGGPTGVCVYEDGVLPERFRGAILNADAGRNVVYAHHPQPDGGGFSLEKEDLIAARLEPGAKEEQRWFRPSDVLVGTDGAIYVADWYDPGVGGHAAGDSRAYGRILRIARRGTNPRPPSLATDTAEGAIAMLGSPSPNVRWTAWKRLVASPADALTHLGPWLDGDVQDHLRARALWVLAASGSDGRNRVRTFLTGATGRLRVAAFRALVAHSDPLERDILIGEAAIDPAPALRREAAVALFRRDRPAPLTYLLDLARRVTADDRWSVEALGIAARGQEEDVARLLLEAKGAHRDPAAWSRDLATVLWRLHPGPLVPAFAARARAASLDVDARRQALDALAFIPDRAAADAMVNLALSGPEDLQPLARWWVRHRDGNLWRHHRMVRELMAEDLTLGDATLRWRSGTMTAGTKDVDIPLGNGEALWLVVSDGGNGNTCDWADWFQPRLEGPAGTLDLCKQPWAVADTGWGQVHVDQNAGGGTLAIGGRSFGQGIGTHAPSRIAWRIPEGYTTFKATVGPDDGGTGQGGNSTSLEFQVLVQEPPDSSWIRAAEATVLDHTRPEADRVTAAEQLAADAKGGLTLLKLASDESLPSFLVERVGDAFRRNPDLGVRALAGARFPRPTRHGTPMPSLDHLVTMPGDPRRGQDVFFGETAQCSRCHTIAGRGGDIGPDLSAIRDKYGTREMLDTILHPSAAIAFGYDSWLVGTTDGELFSGFVLADGEALILKDTSGLRQVIPSSEIDFRKKESVSVMPDDVALGLSPQELVDVVAFLMEDRDAASRQGAGIALFNGRDLTGWTAHLADPAVSPDAVWTIPEPGILRCRGTPAGYIRTESDHEDFILELDWRFPDTERPGNSGVLLRMHGPDKVWPKSIEAQLLHRQAGDIWNIDAVDMEVDASRTNGRHTSRIYPSNEKSLGEWNHYRITLDRGHLTLEVNGQIQNTASWCAQIPGKICLQSEGAPIEFRNIRLTPLRR